MFKHCFKDKKVLITGHSGFKGSWLTIWLSMLGADILGISLKDKRHYTFHESVKKISNLKNIYFNIVNYKKLNKTINSFRPDYIFHLAAQPLVRESVKSPSTTFNSNFVGTLNILETLRFYSKACSVVFITSDKCYEEKFSITGYSENDKLGGNDPYSASKSSAEILIRSYYKTYFANSKYIRLSTARAGNVIGGGDWSPDRIVPDCIRKWIFKKVLIVRNPRATRPWQHVLETLSGYLLLAQNLSRKIKNIHGESFNFGPAEKKQKTVYQLIKILAVYFKESSWKVKKDNLSSIESKILRLNISKSLKTLKWKPTWDQLKAVRHAAEWYVYYFKKQRSFNAMLNFTKKQIEMYVNDAKENKALWTK